MRRNHLYDPRALLVCLLIAFVGCGGKSSRPAKSDAPEEERTAKVEFVDKAPEPSGPDCSDGSCIRCGDAACPKGFFCDETSNPPACQWVPSCKDDVSCACVKPALKESCKCSERDGATFVRCDP
ncbi:MAG: hypothetical protein QM784_06180 [Polyangiaceae bacterium]